MSSLVFRVAVSLHLQVPFSHLCNLPFMYNSFYFILFHSQILWRIIFTFQHVKFKYKHVQYCLNNPYFGSVSKGNTYITWAHKTNVGINVATTPHLAENQRDSTFWNIVTWGGIHLAQELLFIVRVLISSATCSIPKQLLVLISNIQICWLC